MRLKYQMRGLGVGMVVTAILMGVTTGHVIPLTDAEIRARALELGMVESNSLKLSDVAGMSTPEPAAEDGVLPPDTEGMEETGEEDLPPEETEGVETDESRPGEPDAGNYEESQSRETGTGAEEPTESRPEEPDGGNAESQPEEPDEESETQGMVRFVRNGDIVTVIIEPGADSYSISRVLAQAGLVADAGEYDDYLCDNLYSRKIVNGSYDIPMGASEEEIAKIITLGR